MKAYFLKAVVLAGLILSPRVEAYETDQYSSLFHNLSESKEVLDSVVNQVIRNTAREWRGKRNDVKFAKLVGRNLGARQLEYWANETETIDSWNDISNSVYKTVAWFNSPIIRFKGLSNTFKLADVHVGADKLSHFFGVGGIYYSKSHNRYSKLPLAKRIKKITKYGKRTENLYWGELTTNVFSNADLVVNYEGYLFFESLSEQGLVKGKKSIIKWYGDLPIVQRKFSFADHVNDFWSEASLPNHYQLSLRSRVKNVLRTYCVKPEYLAIKEQFLPRNEMALVHKYSDLGIKWNALEYRMDNVCNELALMKPKKRAKFFKKQAKLEARIAKKSVAKPTEPEIEEEIEEEVEEHPLLIELGSGMPGCRGHYEKGVFEHKKILEWNSQTAKAINNWILRKLQVLGPEFISKDFSEQARLVFSFVYPGSQFKVNSYDNGQYIISELSLSTQAAQDEVVTTTISKNKDLLQVCTESEVPLQHYGKKLVRMDQRITIKNCFTYSNKLKKYKSDLRYKVIKSNRTFWSDYDYYPLEDLKGYLYRNIPYFCKWY